VAKAPSHGLFHKPLSGSAWQSNERPLKCVERPEHKRDKSNIERRLEGKPDAMRIRRSTIEHPFGTLKAWMGYTHFLTRTREKVAAEMSLHVLAYNFKRVLKIIGIAPLMAALRV